MRPDPNNPLSEGIETPNFLKSLQWHDPSALHPTAELRAGFPRHPSAHQQRRRLRLHALRPRPFRSDPQLGTRIHPIRRMVRRMESPPPIPPHHPHLRLQSRPPPLRRHRRIAPPHSARVKPSCAFTRPAATPHLQHRLGPRRSRKRRRSRRDRPLLSFSGAAPLHLAPSSNARSHSSINGAFPIRPSSPRTKNVISGVKVK